MRSNKTDIKYVMLINHYHDQPITITFDIEPHSVVNQKASIQKLI
jgi:hypothetical protein